MHALYLLPGIMGSCLKLGAEEIWPPTLRELTVSHYGRLTQLLDRSVISTDVIRKVTDCYEVYGSLLSELHDWGFEESVNGGKRGKVIAWHYDWRRDVRQTAVRLADDLRAAIAAGTTDITLIAHSMGGLVARYALEVDDPALGDPAWRGDCKLLVTLGTPHRGAPLALVRALGMESTMGMRPADIRAFAGNSLYPSAYQLLPPASAFGFWNAAATAEPLSGLDLSDAAVIRLLGLNTDNVAASAQLYAALDRGERPSNCRYFCFIGRKLETVVRGNVDGEGALDAPKIQDGGDGTVPIWSGTLPGAQFQLDGEEHGRTFRDPALLKTLGRLLGVPPEQLRALVPEPIVLKIPKPIYEAAEETRFRIDASLDGGSVIDVYIVPIDPSGQETAQPTVLTSISSQIPSDSVCFSVRVPSTPGLYKTYATLQGAPDPGEPQFFAVQKSP